MDKPVRKEAAISPGPDTPTSKMLNDENMTATASRREAREGHMYSERPAHTIRRFTLGVALAVLALTFVPTLVGQGVSGVPQGHVLRQVAGESVSAPVLAEPAVQESRAPAAFSDALAAAPAGAQCSVEAHACTVPGAGSEAAMTSNETAVAYGFSQTPRSGVHNRM